MKITRLLLAKIFDQTVEFFKLTDFEMASAHRQYALGRIFIKSGVAWHRKWSTPNFLIG